MEKEKFSEEFSGDIVRHSKASYKAYIRDLTGENPAIPFDKNNQELNDLTEKGKELAENSAREYFANLNPAEDKLFFASSNEVRAIETAEIYRKIAKEMGFDIIHPEHSRSKISDEIADGDIRVLDALSLNSDNLLLDAIFQPASTKKYINLSNVPQDLREKFEKASSIVDEDDQGNWGNNFYKHVDRVKEIFPEIKNVQQEYENKFRYLLKHFNTGKERAGDSGVTGNIKVLGFGHENYLLYAIRNIFQEEGINNCEVLHITTDSDGITGKFRNKEAKL